MPHPPSATLSPAAAGDLLKRKREQAGLTQDQIVERAGIPTVTQYSQFENGKVSIGRSKHFPAIARLLSLTEDEVRSINPHAVFDAPAPMPATPRGRFVPSFRLSRYGQAEGLSYVAEGEDVPDVQVVILDSRSMETGGMLEHATLYVNPHERKPEDGRVYVIEAQGAHAVKRAALHDGVIWFYSDAPQYGTPPVQAGRVRVLGRVFRFVNPPHDA